MAMKRVPVNTSTGNADVPGRLAALGRIQRSAVLATESGGQPYTSLVAFVLTPDARGLLFATPRATAKYANIRANPRVSLLIDNRSNTRGDIMKAEAITVTGTAKPVRHGGSHAGLADMLKTRHPELAEFIDADTTALILVNIAKAVHVGGFQKVSVWQPAVTR